MPDALTLADALLSRPGLDGYNYQGDVYCPECGRDLVWEVFTEYPDGIPYPEAEDSETLPQAIVFGRSDAAQHCMHCGKYLYGGEEELEDPELTEIVEGDLVTPDLRRWYQYGKLVLETWGAFGAWRDEVQAYADTQQFWPKVWLVPNPRWAFLLDWRPSPKPLTRC